MSLLRGEQIQRRESQYLGGDVVSSTGGDSSNFGTGTRATFSGGHDPGYSNIIDYFTIPTLGNAQDFGNLTAGRSASGDLGSRTRGLKGGGYTGSNSDIIDFWTFSSTGDAVDFGNLGAAVHWTQPSSSETRGLWAGGNNPGNSNRIEYITISSTGNAVDYGDIGYETGSGLITVQSVGANSSMQSTTRGFFGGGTPTLQNVIEFVTTATLGNSADFGDATTQFAREGRGSNATRGLFLGGTRAEPSSQNIVDFITMATLGNAIDFGDMTTAIKDSAAAASPTRIICAHGNAPGTVNAVDFIEISTTGNAADFGDLTDARDHLGGCSNGHGGL